MMSSAVPVTMKWSLRTVVNLFNVSSHSFDKVGGSLIGLQHRDKKVLSIPLRGPTTVRFWNRKPTHAIIKLVYAIAMNASRTFGAHQRRSMRS